MMSRSNFCRYLTYAFVPFVLFSACDVFSQQIRSSWQYGQRYLYLRDIANYYGLAMNLTQETCELSNRWSKVSFTFDKRDGKFNGIKINYLFVPVFSDNQALVSEKDFNFVLEPLFRSYSIPKQSLKTILIDPGHGGEDPGAVGKKYKEKDITLQIAKKLRTALLKKGYKVYLTRDKDTSLSLDSRSAKCHAVGADLFISIHCNATAKKTITGIETFCLTPEGAPSTSDSKPGQKKENGNAFNKNNFFLAYQIHLGMLASARSLDRSVRHARFAVLRKSPCPSVLVEVGFLSNSWEENRIAGDDYQGKVVSGIVEGVMKYGKTLLGRK